MEIRFDDLVITCPECGGEGRGVKTEGNQFMSRTWEWTCERCLGEGKVLTPQGEELAKFVRYLRQTGFQ